MSKKQKKKETKRLSKKKIFIFILFVCLIIGLINFFNTNITNIYISGNLYLNDQEIIDIAKLSNYPKSIKNLSFIIEKSLEKNTYIYKSKVKKNLLLNKVYIEVVENYPLFYDNSKNKTILYNGDNLDGNFSPVTLTNSVKDKIYDELVTELGKLDIDILNRISEIEYSPNSAYKDRFLILMTDGNYVFITIDKFSTLNKYLDIVKYIDSDQKGVIKLDSGKYFDEFDKEV